MSRLQYALGKFLLQSFGNEPENFRVAESNEFLRERREAFCRRSAFKRNLYALPGTRQAFDGFEGRQSHHSAYCRSRRSYRLGRDGFRFNPYCDRRSFRVVPGKFCRKQGFSALSQSECRSRSERGQTAQRKLSNRLSANLRARTLGNGCRQTGDAFCRLVQGKLWRQRRHSPENFLHARRYGADGRNLARNRDAPAEKFQRPQIDNA